MSKRIELGAKYERKKEWNKKVRKKLSVDGMSRQMEQSKQGWPAPGARRNEVLV